MGIFSIFGAKPRSEGQRFSIADGRTLEANELGYEAARIGFENSQQAADRWFGPGAFAAKLGLAQAISQRRFAADSYIAMLYVATYVWHAQWKLQAAESTVRAITVGIMDGLDCVRHPNGERLSIDDKTVFLKVAIHLSRAIETDVSNAATERADVFRPGPSATAGMLLDVLRRTYSSDADLVSRWRGEMDTPMGIWLSQTIDDSWATMARILQTNLQVQLLE